MGFSLKLSQITCFNDPFWFHQGLKCLTTSGVMAAKITLAWVSLE